MATPALWHELDWGGPRSVVIRSPVCLERAEAFDVVQCNCLSMAAAERHSEEGRPVSGPGC
jgi:hypothetical protein